MVNIASMGRLFGDLSNLNKGQTAKHGPTIITLNDKINFLSSLFM